MSVQAGAAAAPPVDRTLRRAALASVLTQTARVGNPLLLVAIAHAYGSGSLGRFAVAQGLVYLASRVSLFGLDRAMAYWIPQAEASGVDVGLGDALLRTARVGGACSLAFVGYGLGFAEPSERPLLVLSALSIVPVAWLELSLQALPGVGSVSVAPVVRDLLVPILAPVLALLFRASGAEVWGLALGQLLATVVGLAITAAFLSRRLSGRGLVAHGDLPPAIRRKASLLGVSDLATTAMQRIDVLLVARFLAPDDVGVYAIVTQIANTLRSLRTGYEGVTTATVSALDARDSVATRGAKVRAVLSPALELLAITQVPVVAVVSAFGPELLSVFGRDFPRGADAAAIACVGVALQGLFALAGPAAVGLGRTRVATLSSCVAVVVEVSLLVVLLPRFQLLGAGIALASTAIAHGVIQAIALRVMVREPLVDAIAWRTLLGLAAASAVSVGTFALLAPLSRFGAKAVAVGLVAALALRLGRAQARRRAASLPREAMTPSAST